MPCRTEFYRKRSRQRSLGGPLFSLLRPSFSNFWGLTAGCKALSRLFRMSGRARETSLCSAPVKHPLLYRATVYFPLHDLRRVAPEEADHRISNSRGQLSPQHLISQSISSKSPCLPKPPANLPAPSTPSLINASLPLYHSLISASRIFISR